MPLASRPCNLPYGVRFEEISGDSWSPWSICQSRTHRTSTKGKFIKMQDFFHKIQIPGKSAASCIPSFLQIHASEFPLCIFRGPVVAAPLLHEKNIDFRSILAKTAHCAQTVNIDRLREGPWAQISISSNSATN